MKLNVDTPMQSNAIDAITKAYHALIVNFVTFVLLINLIAFKYELSSLAAIRPQRQRSAIPPMRRPTAAQAGSLRMSFKTVL